MQRLEYLDLVLQVPVDEGGDLYADPHVAGVLAVGVAVVEVLRQQLARDVEVAGPAPVLEPPDEGPEPVGVVGDRLLPAGRRSELAKSFGVRRLKE